MLSPHAKSEWTTIFAIGVLLSVAAVITGWWWVSIPVMIATICLILFFRDPDRPIPTQRGIMVSPADGKVSSIHEVEFFEPFNGPATCVRIFLSVFDVHINRSPIHGVVTSITHKPGEHLNVLNPESAEVNESNLIILAHPVRRDTIAAIRQVAGLCARTICCTVSTGSVIQRGQRFGIIKLGSTTELYIPARFNPQVVVEQGQYVYGGSTILANINIGPVREGEEDEDGTTPSATEATTDSTIESDDQQVTAVDAAIATAAVVTAANAATTPDEEDSTEDQVELAEETVTEPQDDDNQATDELEAISCDQDDADAEEDESESDDAQVQEEDESEDDDQEASDEDQYEEEVEENDDSLEEDDEDLDDSDYVEEPDAEVLEEESDESEEEDEVEDQVLEEEEVEEDIDDDEEEESVEEDDESDEDALDEESDEDNSEDENDTENEEDDSESDTDEDVTDEALEDEEESDPPSSAKSKGKSKTADEDDSPMLF
ncbi:MAG TPA: phosphatidylserine decarboxylase family protein [Phycisphaerales bacterium]|nr:phosphatidylserine decarboxylase family protein [Phycisphaerales bacterium]HCD32434.1 phosphatidylserine decarboxylase family protein [Phycisphaerales bacterium]|tara:strand:- start:56318 stop:57790 length:1473 start_codon:yes stop_codon:yes gene_type:complete